MIQSERGFCVLTFQASTRVSTVKETVFASLQFLLLAVICCSLAFSQITTGSITGTVTDPAGAVVVAAKLVVTNQDTGVSTELATNQADCSDRRTCRLSDLCSTAERASKPAAHGCIPSDLPWSTNFASTSSRRDFSLRVATLSRSAT